VSESRVTWSTSVQILVFLGLSVLELGPMNATDIRRQTDRRQTKASLNASTLWGGGITHIMFFYDYMITYIILSDLAQTSQKQG